MWFNFYVRLEQNIYRQAWLQAINLADAQAKAKRICGHDKVYGVVMCRKPKRQKIRKDKDDIYWFNDQ